MNTVKLFLVPRDGWIDNRVAELSINGESRRHNSRQATQEKLTGDGRIEAWIALTKDNQDQ